MRASLPLCWTDVPAEQGGGEVGLQRQAGAESFHDDHALDGAAAETALGFREGQAEDAGFGVFLPDGGLEPVGLGLIGLALGEIAGTRVSAVFRCCL